MYLPRCSEGAVHDQWSETSVKAILRCTKKTWYLGIDIVKTCNSCKFVPGKPAVEA